MDFAAAPGDPAAGGASDSARQLSAIDQVGRLLDDAGLDHWLFGGWAVDFWVGRITRPHDDVDLVVRQSDTHSIDTALTGAGWVHTPDDDEDVGTRYRRAGVLLELTFVVEDGEGRTWLPFLPDAALWSERPFGSARRALAGVTCRVQALEVITADKSTPRDEADDAAKDRADHEALSGLVAQAD